MKRSLGPIYWRPTPEEKPAKRVGLTPLEEGPVVGPRTDVAKLKGSSKANPSTPSVVKPYARGSFKTALDLISSDPAQCRDHLRSRMLADTTSGPQESREKSWHELAIAAGFEDPFNLSVDLIHTVMGALDKAEYRSAELYLWTAKSLHIERGHEWTAQLAQAARRAKAACKRGRGPAKQAQPLPLSDLHRVQDQQEPFVRHGPCCPVRSTVLISWWLLREIEASFAKVHHIQFEHSLKLVHWLLPSSKTDWQALGCTRTHACACSDGIDPRICPYHQMVEQVRFATTLGTEWLFPTNKGSQAAKEGWALTFESIAFYLDLQLVTASGLRKFTGHTARATGAVHMAMNQVELWRIQLFGRWGSDCFKIYVRSAPLSQLTMLARETSVQTSLIVARQELQGLLKQIKSVDVPNPAGPLKSQPVEVLADCENAEVLVEPPATQADSYVLNRSTRGKLHRVRYNPPSSQHYLWHTHCFWYFARSSQSDYKVIFEVPDGVQQCSKCFRIPKASVDQEEDSSASSSSSSSS